MLWARNRALHYLANERLSDDLRHRLTQVVDGYIGRCDEDTLVQASTGCASGIGRAYRRRVSSIEHQST